MVCRAVTLGYEPFRAQMSTVEGWSCLRKVVTAGTAVATEAVVRNGGAPRKQLSVTSPF